MLEQLQVARVGVDHPFFRHFVGICQRAGPRDVPFAQRVKLWSLVFEELAMLWRVHECLAPGGIVYVEVPDGEVAIEHGADREEFCIEHYCAFSMVALAMLVHQAGFRARLIERLVEPSGKFTLRAFLETP